MPQKSAVTSSRSARKTPIKKKVTIQINYFVLKPN
jgi:hypothetical protein